MGNEPVEILLIEDNTSDVELTLHALKKYRVANRVLVLRDGAEAVDFFFGNPSAGCPAVILLDLKLPKISGLELLRQIKADPRTRAIPVVVLTSSREDLDISQAYELGVNSYIVKPVDFAQFAEAVRQVGLYWLMLNEQPARAKN